ncbi:MAG: hypothetical protein ACRCZ9_00340 [Fusobacteriaceae bacterium]
MTDEIKRYHKIVYRAMEFQFETFDTLNKWSLRVSIITVSLSLLLLANTDISKYIILFWNVDQKKFDCLFFILNLFLVISSIVWLIISSKYDITSIGIKAEKYKNIQNKIREAKDKDEAKKYFEEYLNEKPEINNLVFVSKRKINKRLKESGMSEYFYDVK